MATTKTITELEYLSELTSRNTLLVSSEIDTDIAYKTTLDEISKSFTSIGLHNDGDKASNSDMQTVVGFFDEIALFDTQDGNSLFVGSSFITDSVPQHEGVVKRRISANPYRFQIFDEDLIPAVRYNYTVPYLATTKNYQEEYPAIVGDILKDRVYPSHSSSLVDYEIVGKVTIRGANVYSGYLDIGSAYVPTNTTEVLGEINTNKIEMVEESERLITGANLDFHNASSFQCYALNSSDDGERLTIKSSTASLNPEIILNTQKINTPEISSKEKSHDLNIVANDDPSEGEIKFKNRAIIKQSKTNTGGDLKCGEINLKSNLFHSDAGPLDYPTLSPSVLLASDIASNRNRLTTAYGTYTVADKAGNIGVAKSQNNAYRYCTFESKEDEVLVINQNNLRGFWNNIAPDFTGSPGFIAVKANWPTGEPIHGYGLRIEDAGFYMVMLRVAHWPPSEKQIIKKGSIEIDWTLFDVYKTILREGGVGRFAIRSDGARYFTISSASIVHVRDSNPVFLVPRIFNGTSSKTPINIIELSAKIVKIS